MEHLSQHILVDLYGCEADRVGDEKYIEKILNEVATISNTKVLTALIQKVGETGIFRCSKLSYQKGQGLLIVYNLVCRV